MKTSMIIVTILLTSFLSVRGQNVCTKNFGDFASCLHESVEAMNTAQNFQQAFLNPNVQAKINQCFTSNKCDVPDYEHDPCIDLPQPIRSFVDKVRQEIGNCAPPVGQCLKSKFARSLGECVKGIGLGGLIANASTDQVRSSTQYYGDANGFFFASQSNTTTTDQKKSVLIQVNIATAIRRCKESKGNDDNQMKLVLNCLLDTVLSNAQRALCQSANACDEVGTTTECRRQRRQTLHVICTCKREKLSETLRKLDTLRKAESVPILDVVTALGNGKKAEDTCDDIRSCFVDNGEPPPPTLSLLDLFIAMQEAKTQNDKPGSSQMRVDQKTLSVIRDLFDANDFGDDECKPCDL